MILWKFSPRRPVNETVLDGALLLALPIAVLGGLVSFFSPCVLPLVPGYLSYVTGVSGTDLEQARRGRMAAGAWLFVLGFSAVFISGGALFGYFGWTLQEHRETLTRVLGVLMVLMGVFFMGLMPWLTQREFRFHKRPTTGLVGAPVLGALFGIGWTPCIGPTLASVKALAAQRGQRGPGGATDRRVLSGPGPAVRPRRRRVPQGARRVRLGEAALRLGDADRRRHDDRDRSAAAHRCVGHPRAGDAGLVQWLPGGDLSR